MFDWPISAHIPEWNIYGYRNGLLAHQDTESELFGYIDPKDKWVIEPAFKKACGFEEGLAMVVTNRGSHFIDATGQIQFKVPRWSSTASHFTYGLAGDSSGTVYVNRSGECVWRAE